MDGGRIPCADFTDLLMQNAYYDGYTGNLEVTNLFVFNLMGEVIHAAVNFPGSLHDSRMVNASKLLHEFLQDHKTPPGYAVICDSAFTIDLKATKGKLVRGRKKMKPRIYRVQKKCMLSISY